MVDLQGQYLRYKEEIDHAIQEVLNSTAFIKGPDVDKFQSELAEYMGVKHCVACGNGTDALQVAMMALDLKPGDEVITTPFTFIATVEVISLLGLTPVFVDVDPDTFNLDPQKPKKAVTSKTRAIVPVHLFGQAADMNSILEIAPTHNIAIIEDNAQAIGANYTFSNGKKQKAGTIGHVGATSFFPSKNLGAYGDGGAIFTNDDGLAHTLKGIVNHGMYERYHHDVVGVNSRLDSIQAAVLRAKLPKLDEYCHKRREAARKYSKAFEGQENIVVPKTVNDCEGICDTCDCHVFHQYTLKITNGKRDGLVKHFAEKGIPCGVYYPIPLHKQKAYADSRYREEDFPVTNQLVQQVISLPMHTELENEQIEYITKTVIDYVNG